MKATYREWVNDGARGFFLAPSVAVNAAHLIDPSDRSGEYFVRRDTSRLDQQDRRALLKDVDREHAEVDSAHERWILTALVKRPADVVSRGWVRWETLGEVVS